MRISRLSHACEFREDDHTRSGGVDWSSFVEDLGRGPGIVDPDCWVAADEKGYHRALELVRKVLEVDPGLSVGQEVGVANEREWQRAGWLLRASA